MPPLGMLGSLGEEWSVYGHSWDKHKHRFRTEVSSADAKLKYAASLSLRHITSLGSLFVVMWLIFQRRVKDHTVFLAVFGKYAAFIYLQLPSRPEKQRQCF